MVGLVSTDKVIELGGHMRMTVEEALKSCLRADLQEVMIMGYDADGDLIIASSAMSRKDALWLAEKARQSALGDDD
jgi:hypothetical protein